MAPAGVAAGGGGGGGGHYNPIMPPIPGRLLAGAQGGVVKLRDAKPAVATGISGGTIMKSLVIDNRS